MKKQINEKKSSIIAYHLQINNKYCLFNDSFSILFQQSIFFSQWYRLSIIVE